ncbi:hypothetical protein IID20_02085 [Patescibacteria group bacterium]|nr:hypothetical protein [Patescibacteria group bacterium]
MRKDYKKLFTHLQPVEPPAGLFDRIILAIEREQELKQTKHLLLVLFSLSVVSVIMIPFSWTIFTTQMESSGLLYFFSAAIRDVGMIFTLWQDFGLAVIESLPIVGLTIFSINIILILFTIRLFLYKKKLLLGQLIASFN